MAHRAGCDAFILTNRRVMYIDVNGWTGDSINYLSVPYSSLRALSGVFFVVGKFRTPRNPMIQCHIAACVCFLLFCVWGKFIFRQIHFSKYPFSVLYSSLCALSVFFFRWRNSDCMKYGCSMPTSSLGAPFSLFCCWEFHTMSDVPVEGIFFFASVYYQILSA